MKNTLQYAYSIAVLAGVLLTSYLMMNQESNADSQARILTQSAAIPLRSDATVDPGLSQLFEMENALSTRLPQNIERTPPPPPEELIFTRPQ